MSILMTILNVIALYISFRALGLGEMEACSLAIAIDLTVDFGWRGCKAIYRHFKRTEVELKSSPAEKLASKEPKQLSGV